MDSRAAVTVLYHLELALTLDLVFLVGPHGTDTVQFGKAQQADRKTGVTH